MRVLSNQNGDTIVEVLIAIAVVSAVLGGAYAVINHTTANSQQSREHSQALKVAESQLETLRASTMMNGTLGVNQCLSSVNTPNTSCQFNDTGAYDSTGSGRYKAVFTTVDPYKITVTWNGALGGTDKVELSYKVYP